jgi:tetratricopeptide (TPR) repeat protein
MRFAIGEKMKKRYNMKMQRMLILGCLVTLTTTVFAQTKDDKAIADYTQAIRTKPNDAVLYNNRGLAYQRKGDVIINNTPDDGDWGLTWSLAREHYTKAIQDYTEAIRLNAKYAEAYYNRGFIWDEKMRNITNNVRDYAVPDYTEAIRLNPNYAEAYYQRGHAHLNSTGNWDQAIADFTQAIRINPNYAEAYYQRGIVYYNRGDIGRTRADWEQTLRLNPRHPVRGNLEGLR